ncbi:MAG: hypothetical protein K8963_08825 [Proteobacteria bacterium]|nr:hypothetical protein [Pseudomonadota bacterium]
MPHSGKPRSVNGSHPTLTECPTQPHATPTAQPLAHSPATPGSATFDQTVVGSLVYDGGEICTRWLTLMLACAYNPAVQYSAGLASDWFH